MVSPIFSIGWQYSICPEPPLVPRDPCPLALRLNGLPWTDRSTSGYVLQARA